MPLNAIYCMKKFKIGWLELCPYGLGGPFLMPWRHKRFPETPLPNTGFQTLCRTGRWSAQLLPSQQRSEHSWNERNCKRTWLQLTSERNSPSCAWMVWAHTAVIKHADTLVDTKKKVLDLCSKSSSLPEICSFTCVAYKVRFIKLGWGVILPERESRIFLLNLLKESPAPLHHGRESGSVEGLLCSCHFIHNKVFIFVQIWRRAMSYSSRYLPLWSLHTSLQNSWACWMLSPW